MSAAQPKAHLSRRYHFSASHRLHSDAFSDARNREIYGKCNNPYGHGHNYSVEITFSGPVSPVTGMVLDLAELDRFAQTKLLDTFDHQNLNTLALFRDQVPSTENLVVEVHRIFADFPKLSPGVELAQVRVEETSNNSFEYPVARTLKG